MLITLITQWIYSSPMNAHATVTVRDAADAPLDSANRLTLDQCRKGDTVRLLQLTEQPAFASQDEQVTLRLKELGFLPNTQMTVIGFGFLGRDPIAVQVNGTKFALRRTEASKLAVARVGQP